MGHYPIIGILLGFSNKPCDWLPEAKRVVFFLSVFFSTLDERTHKAKN